MFSRRITQKEGNRSKLMLGGKCYLPGGGKNKEKDQFGSFYQIGKVERVASSSISGGRVFYVKKKRGLKGKARPGEKK